MQLQGRTAVITGGTQGIGFGIAQAFLAEGANVVIGSRSEANGAKALAELGAPDRAMFLTCDVLVRSDVDRLVDSAAARFGSVDVLVNNAGGSDGFALVHEMSDEAWDKCMTWSVDSAFWASRRALNHMVDQGWGRIINISSTEGKQASKPTVSHYITAKHALNGFTKAVAFEYGRQGITSNGICPGAIETERMKEVGPAYAESNGLTYEEFLATYTADAMTGQMNTVEQVAALAVLLASEVGAGITGALLNVDGGTASW
ncbi:MAG: fabG 7 [Frankiales bacterium]|nr:fabG 7 [Frankiales bacterium]